AGVFEQAQAQLARNRDRIAGGQPTRFYLLRGLLKCSNCGRRYRGIPSHGRRLYRCAGRDRLHGEPRCQARTMPAHALEAVVGDTVVAILRQPTLLTEKLETHQTRLGVRDVEIRSEVAHLTRELAGVERQEERLLDAYLDDALAGQRDSLRPRLEAL